jgi:hypothetical protein
MCKNEVRKDYMSSFEIVKITLEIIIIQHMNNSIFIKQVLYTTGSLLFLAFCILFNVSTFIRIATCNNISSFSHLCLKVYSFLVLSFFYYTKIEINN